MLSLGLRRQCSVPVLLLVLLAFGLPKIAYAEEPREGLAKPVCCAKPRAREGWWLSLDLSAGELRVRGKDDGIAGRFNTSLGWFLHPRLVAAISVSEATHPTRSGALTSGLFMPSVQWWFYGRQWVRLGAGPYFLEQDVDESDDDSVASGWGGQLTWGEDLCRNGLFVAQAQITVEGGWETSEGDHDSLGFYFGMGFSAY